VSAAAHGRRAAGEVFCESHQQRKSALPLPREELNVFLHIITQDVQAGAGKCASWRH
jgi:hypothetical protein